jgi:protein ImuA
MSREARLQAARMHLVARASSPLCLDAAKGGQDARPTRGVLPFGDERVDGVLPGGGLPLGRWHEAAGEGLDVETGATAGAFVAAVTTPLARKGAVVWVMRRDDLHAPGLFGLGFPTQALIQVRTRDETQALAALEDALGCAGVAAAVGEIEAVDLTAGRRLQLACERHGAIGFVIRRRPFGGPSRRSACGSASATRWTITPAPSEPAPGEPGLGPPRWRVDLDRCRGGRGGAWIMEKTDEPYPLRVVADLVDRHLAPTPSLRLVG